MKTIILNNGVEMPVVGFGTYDLPKDRITEIIDFAYKAGYRKFDTASYYNNEIELGKAFKELGIKREELFIQTKLSAKHLYLNQYYWGNYKRFLNIRSFRSIDAEIETSFRRLGVDYIDMFLVHYPWHIFLKMYRHLEKYLKAGKIRAIGVCSFLPPHIQYLIDQGATVPALSQIEFSPLNRQTMIIEYCHQMNVRPEAMSTFSHFRNSAPRMEIMKNPVLLRIAEAHGKSVPQIVNRWIIDQGISILPKSKNPNHIQENIDIFDIELSDKEREMINGLNQGKFLNYNPRHAYRGMPRSYRDPEWFDL